MSGAPEKVWVHYEPETDDAIWSEYPDMDGLDGLDEFNHYGEYTRSDIAQARINIPWPFYESDHKGRAVKIGLHVITCNEDGTEPTVTWEPSE